MTAELRKSGVMGNVKEEEILELTWSTSPSTPSLLEDDYMHSNEHDEYMQYSTNQSRISKLVLSLNASCLNK